MVNFQDITETAGISSISIPNSISRLGVGWGDFNGDGFVDIFITNHENIPPTLYQNLGDGTFVDVSDEFLPEPVSIASTPAGVPLYYDQHGVAWADFDNDGDRDLFVAVGLLQNRPLRSSNRLFINSINNGGVLDDRANDFGVDYTRARAGSTLWLDYDNDGLLDLFVGSRPNADDTPLIPPTVFRQTDANVFENVGSVTIPDLVSNKSSLLADLTGDGQSELIVVGNTDSLTEARLIIYDLSTSPFTEVALGDISNATFLPLALPITNFFQQRDVVAADFNGDLRTDVYLSRAANNDLALDGQLFINTVNNGLEDQTVQAGLTSSSNDAGTGVVAGDFDNDMDVDLYSIDVFYENQGDGTFISVPNAAGAAFPTTDDITAVTTADYDNDGFLDLFVTALPAPGSLLRNQGNDNHWLQIDLEGVNSNRDGIGATIYATAGGVTQLREQSGGSHKFSQDHSRIHFGLADNNIVNLLEVRWTSGIVQQLENIAANQIIDVIEGIGFGGNDTINGSIGDDRLVGNNGNDSLQGFEGNDTLEGDQGNDRLFGNSGNDLLSGDDGNDFLRGQVGNDRVHGGPGDDTIFGDGGNDFLRGQVGNDTVNGGAGNDTIFGDGGNDFLRGQVGNDTFNGGAGNDTIFGDAGIDTLNGGNGNDTLNGGGGNDTLNGGGGNDTLTGSGGSDRFRFVTPSSGVDDIVDFGNGNDSIEITASSFGGGLSAGVLPASQFVLGNAAQDGNDRFIYNQNTGNLFYDVDGVNGSDSVLLATLSNQAELNASDIVII